MLYRYILNEIYERAEEHANANSWEGRRGHDALELGLAGALGPERMSNAPGDVRGNPARSSRII